MEEIDVFSSPPLVKSKGYNLDYLEMCDDPNFNPFETKNKVVNVVMKIIADNSHATNGHDLIAKHEEELCYSKLPEEASSALVHIRREQPLSPANLLVEEWPQLSDCIVSKPAASTTPVKLEDLEKEDSPPSPAVGKPVLSRETLDDPNFDPFGTKSKISNDILISSPTAAMSPHPIRNTREADCQLLPAANLSPVTLRPSATPKTVKFCEDPPTKISPLPLLETTSEDRIEFLLNKIKSMKQASDLAECSPLSQSDCSFSLPSNLCLPELSLDSDDLPSAGVLGMEYTMDTNCSMIDKDKSVLASHGGDLEVTNMAATELQMKSILASQGGDFLITSGNVEASSIMENSSSLSNMTSENLSHLVLQHEAKLLEKDKQLAAVGHQILERQGEIEKLRWDLASLEEGNGQMMTIVGEFEKTISQIIEEKEKETVCYEMEREKTETERNQILEEIQAVERAFLDLHKKYERTKQVIGTFKFNEDILKTTAHGLCSRFQKGEERYELLKTHAETKLEEANTRLGEVKRSRAAEIAKLTALLKKSEMGVASLERVADEKNRENQELTSICDELISKVGY
eukprot:GFUD01033442.1.p1 GENE.GFUD01033442.1~~GFUD01033442.1.p1  ORF type:complete len:575 (-),score=171.63 GFUD01033442.1:86-1810(-)